MTQKQDVIERARALGFDDIGFTTADPFETQKEVLLSRKEKYEWIFKMGRDLVEGTDPRKILPGARSIIVLLHVYFREAYPRVLERNFGRCYLDDDRIMKDRLAKKIGAFRNYLREQGIESEFPATLPHRIAAIRSGLGTFGKNCLLFANKAAKGGSWVLPIPLVVDHEFEPDEPTDEVGCPPWCKNLCLVACPTRALRGPRHIDPRRCISYLTYYGDGLTPLELREPMGLWVYGCDACQNVCPRNEPWLATGLPVNAKAAAMVDDFDLRKLLFMDREYFEKRIWPHMFYMSSKDIWRWKMNVARAMGNSLDPGYVPDLIKAFRENDDERVKSMAAWALGRIGGERAREALADFLTKSEGAVKEEVEMALDRC
jgi:epoxyqueuosine reductase